MSNYHNGITKKVFEVVSEGSHEVGVTLHGRSAFKDRKGITAQRYIFIIPSSPLISVCKIFIFVDLLPNPLRQWYTACKKLIIVIREDEYKPQTRRKKQ